VVHEDRVFASLGREIQGAVVEALGPVATRVLGQEPVPGIPQNANLEDKIVVSPDKVHAAAREVLDMTTGARSSRSPAVAAPTVLWTPNRNFVA